MRERDVFTVYEKGGGPEPEGDAPPPLPVPQTNSARVSAKRSGQVSESQ